MALLLPESETQCCFENAAARITNHPAGFLHMRWLPGSTSSAATQAALEQLLLLLLQHGWHKVLADQRQKALPEDDLTTWLLFDWLPRATHNVYRYGAIVMPRDIFSRLVTHSAVVQATTQFPLVYHYFDQELPASKWLVAQP